MRIGVPTEIKVHEYRVGLTRRRSTNWPRRVTNVAGASRRRRAASAAATMTTAPPARASPPTPTTVFKDAQLIVKVKEPQAE